MDDNKSIFQIEPLTKILIFFVVLTVFAVSVSLYMNSLGHVAERTSISRQFSLLAGSMRHNFKVSNLNHKAYDAYLLGLINYDQEKADGATGFMEESLGVIGNDNVNNEQLAELVAPRIKETIHLIKTNRLTITEEQLEEIMDHFKGIFLELEQVDKNTNIEIQKLYTRQQRADTRWQLLYKMVAATAFIALLIMTIFYLKKSMLIRFLKSRINR